MPQRLFARPDKRNIDEQERQRIDGYNYAAGQLLRIGASTVGKLEEEAACAFDKNAFDRGIEDALFDFEHRMSSNSWREG